jgi:hypothetical protein
MRDLMYAADAASSFDINAAALFFSSTTSVVGSQDTMISDRNALKTNLK